MRSTTIRAIFGVFTLSLVFGYASTALAKDSDAIEKTVQQERIKKRAEQREKFLSAERWNQFYVGPIFGIANQYHFNANDRQGYVLGLSFGFKPVRWFSIGLQASHMGFGGNSTTAGFNINGIALDTALRPFVSARGGPVFGVRVGNHEIYFDGPPKDPLNAGAYLGYEVAFVKRFSLQFDVAAIYHEKTEVWKSGKYWPIGSLVTYQGLLKALFHFGQTVELEE